METKEVPYFFWDYDLTEGQIRAILRSENEFEKAWVVARLPESARFEDVWRYISLAELRRIFPNLRLKPPVRAAWEYALQVWGSESTDEQSQQPVVS